MHASQVSFKKPEEIAHEFDELLKIAAAAMDIRPPFFFTSIIGKPTSWMPPHHPLSEYKIINIWRLPRTVRYLLNITIPSIPANPPSFGPPMLNGLFWRPTIVLQRPDHNGSYTTFPKEAWFFINGIMTNDTVAQINAALIASLFHRPITLIQNSTSSLITDLLECALGKQWHRTTEAVEKAFPVIHEALKSEKEKVVVLAHSQGTIIISIILDLVYQLAERPVQPVEESFAIPDMLAAGAPAGPEFLFPYEGALNLDEFESLSLSELAKLEVYCFANCANHMTYFDNHPGGEQPVPWLENYGNEMDIVARLGMLAPDPKQRNIRIEGPIYMQPGAWGHLLNEHYLLPIERSQRVGRKKRGKGGCDPFIPVYGTDLKAEDTPRLFAYINGGSPETSG
jgi:hypothetical protein